MSQQFFKFQPERRIATVGEVVAEVRDLLEGNYRDVWVRGELCDLSAPPSGHLYFGLKDDEARLRCACFRMRARYLRLRPENGLEVLARGRLSVYPPRGDLQMIVEHMEPVGEGARRIAFEKLKRKLEAEGLFAPGRKKPLPVLPSKIGVVTSPAGAALRDILHVLQRRNDRLDILIAPARMQGPGAARQIAAGIRRLNRRRDIDVVIAARGGGSSEDLWAFNEEMVARAIADSEIPVISAVGHETDFTIADFTADLRAPTPSAAAEIVSGAREDLARRVAQLRRHLGQAARLVLQGKRRRLHELASHRSFVDAEARLRYYLQRLDELQWRLLKALPARLPSLEQRIGQLERSLARAAAFALASRRQRLESCRERLAAPRARLASARRRAAGATRELERAMNHLLASRRQELRRRDSQLRAFSPLAVLERGYAIVRRPDASVVRSPGDAPVGGRLDVRVARGSFVAERIEDDEG